jgi:CHAT domain-containing protein
VQQQLAADELLLSYVVGSTNTFLVIIRRDAAQVVRLEVGAGPAKALGIPAGPLTSAALNRVLLDDKAGGLMRKLSRPTKAGNPKPTAQLAALWETLLPATERKSLTEGQTKLLTVLPAGPLALLPFETLVVSQADDDDAEYLLDVGPPIAYAPSASVLLNLARRAKKSGTPRFLTLGDPVYSPATSGTSAADRRLGITRADDAFRAGLSRLPYTALESSWVQQVLEGVGLTGHKLAGATATEAELRRNAPGNEIVHLACHGMADQSYGNFFGALAIAPGKPGDPRDDGFLTMAEIYDLDLTGCELSILSACETNFGPHQQGEGVWALSRGFLVAGSRRVIASNWVVDDRAGATLISFFTRDLIKAGKDPDKREYAHALQTAKRQVRREAKWADPFFWSSLVLVGPK